MNTIKQNILTTLAYFDLFNYPLTSDDIFSFLPQRTTPSGFSEALRLLLLEKFIFRSGEFYSLQNQPELAERRLLGNRRAILQLSIAKKMSKILCRFPYVQAIAVSGSLSKNFADEKSDIDFFIITSSNRLWIARTLMHFFKKLSYLAGKQNWLCMNYYVDEMRMEIEEKNIFTAMETVTLLPLEGTHCFQNFIKANNWTKDFFPQCTISSGGNGSIKKGVIRIFFEKIFDTRLGDTADKWLMRVTDKRWKQKARHGRLNDHGGKIGMVAGRHISKPDPKNFQLKVLEKYEYRVKQLDVSVQHAGVE